MRTDPVVEIDAALRFQKSRRAEAQIELEAATHRRDKALGDVDQAQTDIATARAVIRARSIDIDQLLEQRQALIPRPRSTFD